MLAQTQNQAVSTFDLIVVASVLVATLVLTKFSHVLLRVALVSMARRAAMGGRSTWRTRAPRLFHETTETADLRRRQRIAATAAGISRLLATAAWTVAAVVVLQRLQIDPVLAISGAGFLGVAASVGGQHSVNDFLTGIHILLEDRFGEGDELRIKLNDEVVMATVVALGAFATRLENADGAFHIANRELVSVQNVSQRGIRTALDVTAHEHHGSQDQLEIELRNRYAESAGFDHSRDGLVLDGVDRVDGKTVAVVRTARPLTDSQMRDLTRTSANG